MQEKNKTKNKNWCLSGVIPVRQTERCGLLETQEVRPLNVMGVRCSNIFTHYNINSFT